MLSLHHPRLAMAALVLVPACAGSQASSADAEDALATGADASGEADGSESGADLRVFADCAADRPDALAAADAGTGLDDATAVPRADADVPRPDAATPPPAELYSAAAEMRIAAVLGAALEAALATGAQVAVWHGGELVYVRSFGFRDPESTEPVDDETLFQIGSDTKKMTALLALQQVAAGTLALDTTVADALPGLTLAASPEWAGQATLHHLISHQGGLYDETPWTEDPTDASLAETARGEFSAQVWAMSEPGAFFNYANPNFSIAGYMTEVATGRPWPDLAEQNLFAPLGLEHTFARRAPVVETGNYATGTGVYVLPDGSSSEVGPVSIENTVDNGFLRPAGLVWSTASDMATFGGFFLRGDPDVLPDALREAMMTSQVLQYPSTPMQGYGYGWTVDDGFGFGPNYYALTLFSHGGNTLSETSLQWRRSGSPTHQRSRTWDIPTSISSMPPSRNSTSRSSPMTRVDTSTRATAPSWATGAPWSPDV